MRGRRSRDRASGPRAAAPPESTAELLDRWQAAWSGRDPDAFGGLVAPNVHYEDPLTPEPLEGAVELGRHARELWRAFPDVRVEQTGERLSDGRWVSAPLRVLGTHRARLGSLPPTRRFIVVQAVLYGELEGGLLRRARTFFDVYDAAVQLGVLPRRGTLGERALLMVRGYGLRGGRD